MSFKLLNQAKVEQMTELVRTINTLTRALKYARGIMGLMPSPDPDELTIIDAAIVLGEERVKQHAASDSP